jgi:type II secretory ATPase GspE/PulE/Tfp pilus assembly ATPase PilB-like protein
MKNLQRNLLPICGNCKQSCADEEYWSKVRTFVRNLPGPQFVTRSGCDECGKAVQAKIDGIHTLRKTITPLQQVCGTIVPVEKI